MKATQYDPLFQAAGEKYGVDPSILRAIASVESNFNPEAIGPKTRSGRAQGMMQFIPATAKAYGLQDPFNPEQSVDAAARLMRDLQKQFGGDVGKALEAYNGGPRLVGKSKQTAKYREMVFARANKQPAEPMMAAKSAPNQLKQGQMYGEAPKTRPEAPRTVSMGTIEAMPLNYRTAFALQYLADNEPDDDPEVKAKDLLARLDELELSDGTEGKSALTSFFAETTAPTPTAFQIMQSKKQKQQKRAVPSMQVVQGFRKGGEVDISEQMTVGTLPEDAKDYREVLEGLKKSAADIRRGIQYFPADAVGAPVDIANMALTPFGLGSDKPFMGSQYLIDKGVEAGIYEKPSGSGVETLTRMAGLPALATRSVGRGIASLEQSFKGPPEGAIKPRGGIIDPGVISQISPVATQRGEPMLLTATRIAAEMKKTDGLNRPITPEHREKLLQFVDSKYSKYLKTDFGTEKDPVRQAILRGDAVRSNQLDRQLFDVADEYSKKLKASGPEGTEFLKSRADFYYDAGTNIQPTMLVRLEELPFPAQNIVINSPDRVRSLIVDMVSGSRTEDPQLPDEINQLARTYSDSLKKNAQQMMAEGDANAIKRLTQNINFRPLSEDDFKGLDQSLQRSANKELVFDMQEPSNLGELNPDRMIETLAAVPQDKLDRLSFQQAYDEGTKILGSMRSYDKGLAQLLAGRSVQKEFYSLNTDPVFKTSTSKNWVKFTDPRVNEAEGYLMKHSIAGYNNDKPYNLSGPNASGKEAFLSGDAQVFSLRNEKGLPEVTLEYGREYGTQAPKYVEQIQGKFNSAPVEFIPEVLEFMEKNNLQFSPNRRLGSNINVHKMSRSGERLYYDDKDLGKEVLAYEVIDWRGLQEAYRKDPKNLQVIKITKPMESKSMVDKTSFYTTPERFQFLNSEVGPGGFVQLRAQGGFVSKPLYDRA